MIYSECEAQCSFTLLTGGPVLLFFFIVNGGLTSGPGTVGGGSFSYFPFLCGTGCRL